jgi:hypothetical protein
MDRGRVIMEHAGCLAIGDTGEQFHILIQAIACFSAKYWAAPDLLQIAIDALTAARDACADFKNGVAP